MVSIIDEEYCLISTLTHLIFVFKQATNFIQAQVNEQKLKREIIRMEKKFQIGYMACSQYNSCLQKTAGFEDISRIIPQLSEKVIEYIKDTPMFFKRMAQSAQVFKGLDYNTKIYNLSIPLSYGSAIKSVNIKEL